ncbi:MAG: hypothetical protein AAF750_14310 [Planctomycetota bacterium]
MSRPRMHATRPTFRRLLLSVAAIAFSLPALLLPSPSQANTPATAPTTQPATPALTPPPLLAPPVTGPQSPNLTPIIQAGHDIAVIPISGMIYGYTLESLQFRVDKALEGGATMIILELDTPGGYVDSAMDISRYLKGLTGQVDTAAWVHPEALSAGILIAAATQQIVMAPASLTGDCAPIVPGSDLAPTERAKFYAPIKTEFEDSAARNGYDPAIFDAMCRLGVRLYLIEHTTTQQRRVVNQADYDVMVKGRPAAQPSNSANPFGEVLTQVANPAVDRGQWKPVPNLPSGAIALDGRIHDGNSLFTPTQTVAQDIGLSKATVADLPAVAGHFNANSIQRLNPHWSVLVGYFVTHPAAKGLLLVIIIICGWLEISSPGLGVPGILALCAGALLFGGGLIVGLADLWHILLFVFGVLLIILEVAVIPGFGIAGILGILCVFTGIALVGVPSFTQNAGAGQYAKPGATSEVLVSSAVLLGATIAAIVAVGFLVHYLQKYPRLNKLVLTNDPTPPSPTPDTEIDFTTEAAARPYDRFAPPSDAPIDTNDPADLTVPHVGMLGTATTYLRPAGNANFPDLPPATAELDVFSNGPRIPPGTPVRITAVEGNHITVEPAKG